MARFCTRQSVIYSIIWIFILVASSSAQVIDLEWIDKLKQIQVMQSQKQDVENIFQSLEVKKIRKGKGSQTVDYKINNGRLSISDSTGQCSLEENIGVYDVEDGVVIGVYLFLLEPVKISKLHLNLRAFEKYNSSESNAWIYTNDELGIQYSGGKKTIYSIELYPADKYDHLYCKSILKTGF